ncbi:type II toxin-antitoxin system HicB family antitoxin [Streptococcus marmotae]|uniref:type II toxin-antitoxin system HicB family antitoxin n=1 Tax=Streptococcus marmotae TaxID=1825069 RepID=UPI00082CA95F|nr:type II toxin-antitoxin system HicB family antitoxin [Streptococcus marmotae]QBX08740.1 hypothetical protein JavanS293_0003 [Streptococcus satellite phage Javan293]
MLVTYPALFYYDDTNGTNVPYFVHFPDIDGSGTQGTSLSDAMAMASEYLGIMVAYYIESNRELPKPSEINNLSLMENNPFKDEPDFLSYDPGKSFVSLVMVDVAEYLGSQEPIKKTLTIPRWADKLGRELGLNFSQTLTEAIADKKIQA